MVQHCWLEAIATTALIGSEFVLWRLNMFVTCGRRKFSYLTYFISTLVLASNCHAARQATIEDCAQFSNSSWSFYYGTCAASPSDLGAALTASDANNACQQWCSSRNCDFEPIVFDDNKSCLDDAVPAISGSGCIGDERNCVKAANGNHTSMYEFTCQCVNKLISLDPIF